MRQVQRHCVTEFSFPADRVRKDPFNEVQLDVPFTGPGGHCAAITVGTRRVPELIFRRHKLPFPGAATAGSAPTHILRKWSLHFPAVPGGLTPA